MLTEIACSWCFIEHQTDAVQKIRVVIDYDDLDGKEKWVSDVYSIFHIAFLACLSFFYSNNL